MVKLFLYFEGKPRDEHANKFAAEFLKRASRYFPCESREIQTDRFDLFAVHSSAFKVMLDPAGRTFDSEGFARQIVDKQRQNARDIVFFVGGADGLPGQWKSKADLLLSLSPMTFPHELARAILAEQIYRAAAILHGHPYARH
jgi:23S rRNA (pseudouridine1915-N3)-methyltransferase